MKLLDIINSATSNMMRSKVRTILTITAIFIGAFTITLTIGISSGVSSYIDKQVGSIGAKDMLMIRPKIDLPDAGPQKYDPNKKSVSAQSAFMTSTLDANDINKIKSENKLTEIKPVVIASPDYISGKNNVKYKLDIQPFIESMSYDFVAGKIPNNKTNEFQIMLTPDYVDVLGYDSGAEAVGKKVTLAIKTPKGEQKILIAKISGVNQKSILSQGGMTANDSLVSGLYSIQTEGVPSEISNKYMEVVATFDNKLTEKEIQKIKDRLLEKGYKANTVNDQIGIIKNVIDAITYVLIFFGAIALVAASFGIINTLFMSVQERTKEIGLMKAMGMSRSKVFLLFSVEAVLLGFWGSLIGILTAIGVGQVVNKFASETILKDLPGFDLTVFPISSIAVVMLIVITIAFLAGTLPARRASKLDPIEALRYE